MKYELILFDADETLFDFKKAEGYALEKLIQSLGIQYDEQHHRVIYTSINKSVWTKLEEGRITAQELKIERAKRLLDELEIEALPEEVAKLYLEYLAEASFLYEEVGELLEYLDSKYRLAIITNGLKAVQDKRIRESEIAHFFEYITISEDINIAKPDPKIFEHTLERLNHEDKSKVLMIGDSLTSDIQGGINFEIDTCWFNPGAKINDGKALPTYEIRRLVELKEII